MGFWKSVSGPLLVEVITKGLSDGFGSLLSLLRSLSEDHCDLQIAIISEDRDTPEGEPMILQVGSRRPEGDRLRG